MSEAPITTVDLLRHGMPVGGLRYRGSLDDALSEQGWEQMWAAVGDDCPWHAIISSPLIRCADFARKLAERHAVALEIQSGFREISFGEWEGRTAAEIMAATPDALRRFWHDPLKNPPPGGEPLRDCERRVKEAWKTLLESHAGHHVLVIGHGGTIRLMLRQVLEIPLERLWRLEVPHAATSRVRVYGLGTQAEPLLAFHGKISE